MRRRTEDAPGRKSHDWQRIHRDLAPFKNLSIIVAVTILALGPWIFSGQTEPSGFRANHFPVPNRLTLAANTSSSSDNDSGPNGGFLRPAFSLNKPSWPASSSWVTYQWNSTERSGFNRNETTLNRTNAHSLRPIWSFNTSGPVTGSAIEANNTVYFGSWNGVFYALYASNGSQRWNQTLTNPVTYTRYGNVSNHGGIYSTPTYQNGVIYETAGSSRLYALNASTGSVLWWSNVASNLSSIGYSYYLIWSSPLIYSGYAYVGLASASDGHLEPGQLVKVPLSGNHNVTTNFTVDWNGNPSTTGGGIWSTPSIDPSTKYIWLSTGNENNSAPPGSWGHSREILALNATTLAIVYHHRFGSHGTDADFGSGPTLFSNSTSGEKLAGAINKDGTFHTVDRNNNSDWTESLATSSWLASIAPAAYDGSTLFITGAQANCKNGVISSGGEDGLIVSVNTSTLSGWSKCTNAPPAGAQGAFDEGGLSGANGLVLDVADQLNAAPTGSVPAWQNPWGNATLEVRNSSNGSVLYSHLFNRSSYGEPIISDGRIYVTLGNISHFKGWDGAGINLTGGIVSLGIPLEATLSGSVTTFTTVPSIGIESGLNLSMKATISGGMPGYACTWVWGDGQTTGGCTSYPNGLLSPFVDHPYIDDVSYNYTGNLTVIDESGASVVIQFDLSVGYSGDTNPQIGFAVLDCAVISNSGGSIATCTSSFSGLNIECYSYAAGGTSPYATLWLFGDGGSSTLVNPLHTYLSSGAYGVTVRVTDAHGYVGLRVITLTVPA
jgi:hypothetical protein